MLRFTDSRLVAANLVFCRVVKPADDLTIVKSWFQQCLDRHTRCREAYESLWRDSPRALPSRLLNILHSQGQEICLITEFPQDTQFATLSHCWGQTPVIQTTSQSLDQYKQGIQFEALSKTFQDAVVVCRSLEIRYLWIDSLCIVQDDPLDWEQEGAKMADIYTGSHLNISALAAPDGTGGCFYPRNKSVRLRYASAQTDVDFIYISKKPTSYELDMARARLASRAWVLQEIMLPIRSLLFGKDQLHWDCLETLQSESLYRHIASRQSEVNDIRQYLIQDIQPESVYGNPSPFVDIFTFWYRGIEEYTKCNLTKGEDKLPALGGLSAAFSRRSGCTYVAGLWQEDIVRGMLWEVHEPENTTFPSKYRSPSWSWASINGRVLYQLAMKPFSDARTVLIEAVRPEIHRTGQNLFGMVSSGTKLYMTGLVKKFETALDCNRQYPPGHRPLYPLQPWFGDLLEDGKRIGNIHLDENAVNNPGTEKEVHCLPLYMDEPRKGGSYPDRVIKSFRIEVLVLEATGETNTYRRLGLGWIDQLLLEDVGKYQDSFEGIEKIEIILV